MIAPEVRSMCGSNGPAGLLNIAGAFETCPLFSLVTLDFLASDSDIDTSLKSCFQVLDEENMSITFSSQVDGDRRKASLCWPSHRGQREGRGRILPCFRI